MRRASDQQGASGPEEGAPAGADEALFRATFEQAPVGLSHNAPDGRWLRVNDRLLEITGYSREELTSGMTFQDITHPDDLEADVERARRLGAGEVDAYSLEKRYVRKDGSAVWVDLTVSAVRGPAGEPRHFVALIEDASERREAEQTQRFLAEAGETLSSSLDYRATLAKVARLAVPPLADWCGVDVLAEDGTVERLAVAHEDPQKVRLAYELQERYPADPEAPGGVPSVLRTGSPEFYPEVTDAMLEAVARNAEHLELLREIGFTSVIVVPMAARGRTLGAVTLVSSESGRRFGEADLQLAEELARRAATAVDNARLYEEAKKEIAERRRAQEELRESEERYRAVIEQEVAEGIYLLDAATRRVVETNPALQRMLGYSAEELEGMELYDLIDLPQEEVDATLRLTLERGYRPVGERRYRRKDGTAVEVEIGASVIRAGDKEIVCALLRDVTERKRAEAALHEIREAERARVARELHDGPLQDLVYGFAEVQIAGLSLADELADDHPAAAGIRRASGALGRVSEGLRAAVHDLRLGVERDRPLPTLVVALVERERSMDPKCTISLEVREGFPSGPAGNDGAEVLRVVGEALTNVRRHSGARNVRVSLGLEAEDLVVEVADDGRGFGPETAPGVGRGSMRERAEALGGTLEVESAPGEGTRVRLRVPASDAWRDAPQGEIGTHGEGR